MIGNWKNFWEVWWILWGKCQGNWGGSFSKSEQRKTCGNFYRVPKLIEERERFCERGKLGVNWKKWRGKIFDFFLYRSNFYIIFFSDLTIKRDIGTNVIFKRSQKFGGQRIEDWLFGWIRKISKWEGGLEGVGRVWWKIIKVDQIWWKKWSEIEKIFEKYDDFVRKMAGKSGREFSKSERRKTCGDFYRVPKLIEERERFCERGKLGVNWKKWRGKIFDFFLYRSNFYIIFFSDLTIKRDIGTNVIFKRSQKFGGQRIEDWLFGWIRKISKWEGGLEGVGRVWWKSSKIDENLLLWVVWALVGGSKEMLGDFGEIC